MRMRSRQDFESDAAIKGDRVVGVANLPSACFDEVPSSSLRTPTVKGPLNGRRFAWRLVWVRGNPEAPGRTIPADDLYRDPSSSRSDWSLLISRTVEAIPSPAILCISIERAPSETLGSYSACRRTASLVQRAQLSIERTWGLLDLRDAQPIKATDQRALVVLHGM